MRKNNKKLVNFNIHDLHRVEIFLDSGGDKVNNVELSPLFIETFIRQHYLPSTCASICFVSDHNSPL